MYFAASSANCVIFVLSSEGNKEKSNTRSRISGSHEYWCGVLIDTQSVEPSVGRNRIIEFDYDLN